MVSIMNWIIIIVFRKCWNTTWMEPDQPVCYLWSRLMLFIHLTDSIYFCPGIQSSFLTLFCIFFLRWITLYGRFNFKSINWNHIKNQWTYTHTNAHTVAATTRKIIDLHFCYALCVVMRLIECKRWMSRKKEKNYYGTFKFSEDM